MHGGKSTGPNTDEGKAVAAANSLKHGTYSSAILEQEEHEYEAAEKVKDLRNDLALARLRPARREGPPDPPGAGLQRRAVRR